MMMLTTIKALHLLGGTVFLGISIASYFYLWHSQRLRDHKLLHYALSASLKGDLLQVVLIVAQFTTATLLVKGYHHSFSTPWIKVAYLAFSLVAISWFFLVLLKLASLRYGRYRETKLVFKPLFHLLYWFIFCLFVVIIHDAIMQQTALGFLVRWI